MVGGAEAGTAGPPEEAEEDGPGHAAGDPGAGQRGEDDDHQGAVRRGAVDDHSDAGLQREDNGEGRLQAERVGRGRPARDPQVLEELLLPDRGHHLRHRLLRPQAHLRVRLRAVGAARGGRARRPPPPRLRQQARPHPGPPCRGARREAQPHAHQGPALVHRGLQRQDQGGPHRRPRVAHRRPQVTHTHSDYRLQLMDRLLLLDNKTLFAVALLAADFLLGLRRTAPSPVLAKIIESESKLKLSVAEVKKEKAGLLAVLKQALLLYEGLEDKEDTGEVEAAIRVAFPVAMKEKEDKIQVLLKTVQDSIAKWKKASGQSVLKSLPERIVEPSAGLSWSVEFVTNLLEDGQPEEQELRVVVQIGRVLQDGDVQPERLEMSLTQFEAFRKDVKQAVGYL